MKRRYKAGKTNTGKVTENHDIISEQEFTIQGKGASTDPQEDSPGDSEQDSGAEFYMGMNYEPIATELADEEEELQNRDSAVERPNDLVLTPQEPKLRIPTSAMIKSSEQPSPWEDRDRPSSSN